MFAFFKAIFKFCTAKKLFKFYRCFISLNDYFLTWLAWCYITFKLILSIFIVNDIFSEPDCFSKLSRNKQVFSKRGVFRRSRGCGLKKNSATPISDPPILDWCAVPDGGHTKGRCNHFQDEIFGSGGIRIRVVLEKKNFYPKYTLPSAGPFSLILKRGGAERGLSI